MSSPRSVAVGTGGETPATPSSPFSGKGPDSPDTLTGALSFTQDQLDEFEAQANDWQNTPDSLKTDLARTLLVHIQVLDHVVRHPPEGKSGVAAVMVAHREWRASAEILIESFLKQRGSPSEEAGAKKSRG